MTKPIRKSGRRAFSVESIDGGTRPTYRLSIGSWRTNEDGVASATPVAFICFDEELIELRDKIDAALIREQRAIDDRCEDHGGRSTSTRCIECEE